MVTTLLDARLASVTEVGFVSLLVGGFGALAGVLVYLGVRIARDPAPGSHGGRRGAWRGRA